MTWVVRDLETTPAVAGGHLSPPGDPRHAAAIFERYGVQLVLAGHSIRTCAACVA